MHYLPWFNKTRKFQRVLYFIKLMYCMKNSRYCGERKRRRKRWMRAGGGDRPLCGKEGKKTQKQFSTHTLKVTLCVKLSESIGDVLLHFPEERNTEKMWQIFNLSLVSWKTARCPQIFFPRVQNSKLSGCKHFKCKGEKRKRKSYFYFPSVYEFWENF